MEYKKIGANECAKMPEQRKQNALAIPAIRNGITVFMEMDATYSNPPMAAITFAMVTKLIKKGTLK
jgi:hypothetical protein